MQQHATKVSPLILYSIRPRDRTQQLMNTLNWRCLCSNSRKELSFAFFFVYSQAFAQAGHFVTVCVFNQLKWCWFIHRHIELPHLSYFLNFLPLALILLNADSLMSSLYLTYLNPLHQAHRSIRLHLHYRPRLSLTSTGHPPQLDTLKTTCIHHQRPKSFSTGQLYYYGRMAYDNRSNMREFVAPNKTTTLSGPTSLHNSERQASG